MTTCTARGAGRGVPRHVHQLHKVDMLNCHWMCYMSLPGTLCMWYLLHHCCNILPGTVCKWCLLHQSCMSLKSKRSPRGFNSNQSFGRCKTKLEFIQILYIAYIYTFPKKNYKIKIFLLLTILTINNHSQIQIVK